MEDVAQASPTVCVLLQGRRPKGDPCERTSSPKGRPSASQALYVIELKILLVVAYSTEWRIEGSSFLGENQ